MEFEESTGFICDLYKLHDKERLLIEAFLDDIEETQNSLDLLQRNAEHNAHPTYNVKAIDCFLNKGVQPISNQAFGQTNKSIQNHLLL